MKFDEAAAVRMVKGALGNKWRVICSPVTNVFDERIGRNTAGWHVEAEIGNVGPGVGDGVDVYSNRASLYDAARACVAMARAAGIKIMGRREP